MNEKRVRDIAVTSAINNVSAHYEEVIWELEEKLRKCGIDPDEDLSESDYEDIRRRLDRIEVPNIEKPRVCLCELCNRPMLYPAELDEPEYEGSWPICDACCNAYPTDNTEVES